MSTLVRVYVYIFIFIFKLYIVHACILVYIIYIIYIIYDIIDIFHMNTNLIHVDNVYTTLLLLLMPCIYL